MLFCDLCIYDNNNKNIPQPGVNAKDLREFFYRYGLFAFHDDLTVFHAEGKAAFVILYVGIVRGCAAVGIAIPAHFAFAASAGGHKPGAIFIAAVFFNVAQPGKAAGAEYGAVINKGSINFRRHRNLS